MSAGRRSTVRGRTRSSQGPRRLAIPSRLFELRPAEGGLRCAHHFFALLVRARHRSTIGQWRLVLELEPRHPSARKRIEQAEAILNKLEERAKR